MRPILFFVILSVPFFTSANARAARLVHPNPKCPLVLEDIGIGLPEELSVEVIGPKNDPEAVAAEIKRIERMSGPDSGALTDEEILAPVAFGLVFPITEESHARRVLLRVISVMQHPEPELELPEPNDDGLSMGWGSMMGSFNAHLFDAEVVQIPFPGMPRAAMRRHPGPYSVFIPLKGLSKYDALQLLKALRFD